MKRLPLLGLILALASCAPSLGSDDQTVACYDTGHGMKCVPLSELPSGSTATCINKGDGKTDGGTTAGTDNSDSDSDEASNSASDSNGDGNSDSSAAGDSNSNSDSTDDSTDKDSDSAKDCAAGADVDSDGISDSKDCDCLGPDNPQNTPTPPGDPGPVIN
jgi:clumping factor A